MTREEAKRRAELYSALAEGKTIQDWTNNTWKDKEYTSFGELSQSPIKPHHKYRPFKSQEECWNEMLKHQPFGWVKSPHGELFCIDKVFEEGIVYKHSSCHFNEYLEGQYSFVDGTPFGIKEE